MEEMLGEVITAVVVALVAAAWRKLEKGKMSKVIRAVVEGVEEGTREMPAHEAEKVKQAIKGKAELTKVQATVHAIVKRITEREKAEG
jgi:hypothetical protein